MDSITNTAAPASATEPSTTEPGIEAGTPQTTSTPTPQPEKPRYRLDADSSATITLADGRKLGYAEYGVRSGKPVFYLHGLPGSRLEAAGLEASALASGARIISVDRPGTGLSSPQPGRTLLDHPRDVEALAEHLGLSEYAVLGISAGGSYALACAKGMSPEKLKAVSVVCGPGPRDIGYAGMNFLNSLGFRFGFRYFPGLVRWHHGRGVPAMLDLSDDERLRRMRDAVIMSKPPQKDLEVLDDDELRLMLRSCRDAFAQGFGALPQDGTLISSNFGFRIEDIRRDLPIHLWYGKLDTFVPCRHGEQVAARLGPAARLRVEDETHASLVVKWKAQILDDLVRSM